MIESSAQTCPPTVLDLIARFDAQRDAYRAAAYNETQVRREFIDPFFKALGWDTDNAAGLAEAYKDVIHEDAIKVGGETKAPDYCFRIGGTRKFFVEAKKPSVAIGDDPIPAFQLRRYGWSARMGLSILTDFEEFAVYDCRIRPLPTDKPSVARVFYCTFDQYHAKWTWIAGHLSKDAILKGAFDRFAESTGRKRGTAPVDTEFLREIETWRDVLARNIALRNPRLSVRDLNFAVGKIIDRIIFLRMCEDRGIETYAQLRDVLNGAAVYRRLCELFRRADDRYNSGLFHFQTEKGRPEEPDEVTPTLDVDDQVLKDIIHTLYYPESPYEFSVLPAEILGQVYEQFLGKIIRLTAGHRAVVEEKPEVRKAGGVYYTPAYIVDYIVQHTVGALLTPSPTEGEGRGEGQPSRTPRAITPDAASKLRILDPACGSGSFLLGAYQYLLDWHRDWYIADGPEKWTTGRNPRLYEFTAGYRLTTAERKRILLNNIYGVDVDPQAVEVTKLSLLLKVLEGESRETLERQLKLYHERALPDLGANIKCGNSLIGPDFFNGHQLELFDDEQRLRINAFDWQAEFPAILETARRTASSSTARPSSGFDVVIGNPPYIRIQNYQEVAPLEAEYCKRHFASARAGNFDIYVVFVERALDLMRRGGQFGFILPSKFFATDYGRPLREILIHNNALSAVVDFGHDQVFEGSTAYTCLLFLGKPATSVPKYAKWSTAQIRNERDRPGIRPIEHTLGGEPWVFQEDAARSLIEKLSRNALPLLALNAKMSRGSSTGNDDVFMLRVSRTGMQTRAGETVRIEPELLRTPIYATDFARYAFHPQSGERVIFPYEVSATGYSLLSETQLKRRFPLGARYLSRHRSVLQSRAQYQAWYGFSAPRNLNVHQSAHLLIPLLANTGSACALPERTTRYCPMASGGFSISISPLAKYSPRYVLGLLNSATLFWNLRAISNVFRGGWITCTKQYVGRLPIHQIDFADRTQVLQHDSIVAAVTRMLALHKKLAAARNPTNKTALQRQIAATDRQIDQLVYDLYGLSDDEIRIVEESTAT